MQTIYVNDNKIEFSTSMVRIDGYIIRSEVFLKKNDAPVKANELSRYEKESVEDHIETLIRKGKLC